MSHDEHARTAPPPTGGGLKGLVGGGLVVLAILLTVVFLYATREKDTPTNASASASEILVQRDPRKHQCYTPCSIDIFWPARIEGPGAKTEVETPLKGGKYHKFVFSGDEQLDFSKEKTAEGKPFEIWMGKYYFATPDKPGLLVTVFNIE